MAEVPEAVAFAILAGVPPLVGLYASFLLGLVTSAIGGRPGMISGAAGSLAVVHAKLLIEVNGNLDYLFATLVLTGIIQMLVGIFKFGKFIRFISVPVMLGFLNGLAIIILIAQFSSFKLKKENGSGLDVKDLFDSNSSIYELLNATEFNTTSYFSSPEISRIFIDPVHHQFGLLMSEMPGEDQMNGILSWIANSIGVSLDRVSFTQLVSYSIGAFGSIKVVDLQPTLEYVDGATLGYMIMEAAIVVIIMFTFPLITSHIPPSLVGIAVATAIEYAADLNTITIGDKGELLGKPPRFHFPRIPVNMTSITIILQYAFILAAIGLLESLMTAQVLNDMTNTKGQGNRECFAQGLGNFVCGWFGAMGGCAMIGQSVLNITSGGRGRLSGVTTSMLFLIIIVGLHYVVAIIPLASLVGVMIVVVINTFSWSSLLLIVQSIRMRTGVSIFTAVIIIAVTLTTVFTNLAYGVAVGIGIEALLFSWESGKRLKGHKKVLVDDTGTKLTQYNLSGPLFFASRRLFNRLFDVAKDSPNVVLDFSNTRIVDVSSLFAIDSIIERYASTQKQVHIVGVDAKAKKYFKYLNRSLPNFVQALKYEKLVPVMHIVSYDNNLIPSNLSALPKLLVNKTECFKERKQDRENKWRDAIRIGIVTKHSQWDIHITEWVPLTEIDLTKLSTSDFVGLNKLRKNDREYILSMLKPNDASSNLDEEVSESYIDSGSSNKEESSSDIVSSDSSFI